MDFNQPFFKFYKTKKLTKFVDMETIVIQTDIKKAKAIKHFLEAFDVSFSSEASDKSTNSEKSPYNPEFVKKIRERQKSAREGNVVEYTEELRKELFGDKD